MRHANVTTTLAHDEHLVPGLDEFADEVGLRRQAASLAVPGPWSTPPWLLRVMTHIWSRDAVISASADQMCVITDSSHG